MRIFYCLMILLCPQLNTAQVVLKTGDIVPDVKFTKLVNAATGSASLHKFKSKLLLLDFWMTTCIPCLQEIPTLDSMQKAHPRDLAVLLVSSARSDNELRLANAMKRIYKNSGIRVALPVVLGDTLLNNLFAHTYVPHYAWLDSNFKVVAITGDDEATPKKIEAWLQGKQAQFIGNQAKNSFDPSAPLFINGNGGNGEQLVFRSTLSGHIREMASLTQVTRDSSGMVTRMLLTNQSMLALLQRAYHYFNYPAHIRWPEGEEALLNPRNKPKEWFLTNSYTYELICPPMDYDSARVLMQQDLRRFFNYQAQVQQDSLIIQHLPK